jgi:HAD superfamily hydrolase (TIGR01490 family)
MPYLRRQRLKKLAIFDVDGTIFRSSLAIELVRAFLREGIFKPSAAKIFEKERQRWLNRAGSYEDYVDAVVHAFIKNLKGVARRDFIRIARQEVLAAQKDHVYRFTRDLVRDLKRKGYWLVAVSHSPRDIVGLFAEHLGFDKAYGIVYEMDGTRRFTGKMLFEDVIFDKAKVMRRILAKEPVTLRGSVGVGDTESDVPFLRMVSHPICFNPNQKLFKAAKRFGWQVVVERKDVIYKLPRTRRAQPTGKPVI